MIFGGAGPRTRAYSDSLDQLKLIVEKFQIHEILDIGPSLKISLPAIDKCEIKEMGIKSSEEISQILSESFIGFMDYTHDFL